MIKLKQLILEITGEEGLHVNSRPEGVSISMSLGDGYTAVASIDNIGGGQWWVARVLVGPPHGRMPYGNRRKGIGSMLVKRAVQEVLKHEPNARIVVEPGGTYGMKEEDQLNFYKHNGFVDIPGSPGALVYGGNQ